jgi:hypothetical protein
VFSLGILNVSLLRAENSFLLPANRAVSAGFTLQILTAILNRYYNFAHPDSTVYLIWYVGEVGTIILVGNLPLCWHLLQYAFRLNAWSHHSLGRNPVSPRESTRSFVKILNRFGGERRRGLHDELITDFTATTQTEESFVGYTDKAANHNAVQANYDGTDDFDARRRGNTNTVEISQEI